MSDEREIITLCKKGDRHAFRELYHRYRGLIMKIAYSMVRNFDTAADIMHDVFVKILIHVKAFDEKSTFSTWLYVLTRNTCLDRIRKEKRAASTEYLDTEKYDEARLDIRMHAEIPSADDVCVHREYDRRIAAALKILSPTHRMIFEMRELHGMSYEEIATSLGCPVGTVTSRLFYARKKIGKHVSRLPHT